jgi:hypothetical protein
MIADPIAAPLPPLASRAATGDVIVAVTSAAISSDLTAGARASARKTARA